MDEARNKIWGENDDDDDDDLTCLARTLITRSLLHWTGIPVLKMRLSEGGIARFATVAVDKRGSQYRKKTLLHSHSFVSRPATMRSFPVLLVLVVVISTLFLDAAAQTTAAAAVAPEDEETQRGGLGNLLLRKNRNKRRHLRSAVRDYVNSNNVYMWAASGTGLRAMTASAGFANLFKQAYLVGSKYP